MVVVSNRLPFVLVRREDGGLERRSRWRGAMLVTLSLAVLEAW